VRRVFRHECHENDICKAYSLQSTLRKCPKRRSQGASSDVDDSILRCIIKVRSKLLRDLTETHSVGSGVRQPVPRAPWNADEIFISLEICASPWIFPDRHRRRRSSQTPRDWIYICDLRVRTHWFVINRDEERRYTSCTVSRSTIQLMKQLRDFVACILPLRCLFGKIFRRRELKRPRRGHLCPLIQVFANHNEQALHSAEDRSQLNLLAAILTA